MHDFKAALEDVGPYGTLEGTWGAETTRAIIFALRLADKLMQEPSEGMGLAGIDAWKKSPMAVITQWKKMRDQLIRELSTPCQCNANRDAYGGPYECECKK